MTNNNNKNNNNEVTERGWDAFNRKMKEENEGKAEDTVTTMKINQSTKDKLVGLEGVEGTQQDRIKQLIDFYIEEKSKKEIRFDYSSRVNSISNTLDGAMHQIASIIADVNSEYVVLEESMKTKHNELEERFNILKESYDKKSADMEDITAKLNNAQTELESEKLISVNLNNKVKELEVAIETKNEELINKEEEMKNAIKKLEDSKNAKIEELNARIKVLEDAERSYNLEVKELREKADKYKDLEIKNATLDTTNKNLKEELDKVKEKAEQLNIANATLEANIIHKQEKIDDLKTDIDKKETKIDELTNINNANENAIREKSNIIINLEDTITTRNMEIEGLAIIKANLEADIKNKDEEIEQIKESKNREINNKNEEIGQIKETRDIEINNKNEEIKQIIEAKDREINDLKNKLNTQNKK